MDPAQLTLRSYDPRDETAVWTLHEWAMRDAGVDPTDVPGTDDLRTVGSSYFDVRGTFVVAIDDVSRATRARTADEADIDVDPPDRLATHDGVLTAMGGYVPNQAGHADEREYPGAAELHRMRVAPPYQRREYGRTLLAELERRVVADGFNTLLATTSTAGAYDLVHFEKEL